MVIYLMRNSNEWFENYYSATTLWKKFEGKGRNRDYRDTVGYGRWPRNITNILPTIEELQNAVKNK